MTERYYDIVITVSKLHVMTLDQLDGKLEMLAELVIESFAKSI